MEVWEFEANYLCLQSLCSSFHTACLSHHTNSTSWIAQSSPTPFHEIKPKSQKCFLPETVGTHCLPFTDLETNEEKVMMWDTWHRASFQDCHFPLTTFTSLITSLSFLDLARAPLFSLFYLLQKSTFPRGLNQRLGTLNQVLANGSWYESILLSLLSFFLQPVL